MSSSRKAYTAKIENSINIKSEEINFSYEENKIRFIKRTLENNTHEVIEDTKLKNISTWRKSEKKFLQNLIFNILSLGIIHIISLFYPNLYLKLYCKPWPPKECDFFLVENIYGEFKLCTKIHKKDKNKNNDNYNSDFSKDRIVRTSFLNFNNNSGSYLTKNLTYSFQYKSQTYEYNEETNEIIPVYMNISKMTNKSIFNFFGDGLYSDNLIKLYEERYGKNEYSIDFKIIYLYLLKIEVPYISLVLVIGIAEFVLRDYISIFAKYTIVAILISFEFIIAKILVFDLYKRENSLDGNEIKLKVKRKNKLGDNNFNSTEIKNIDLLPGDILFLKTNDYVPCDCLILEGECIVNQSHLTGSFDMLKKTSLQNNNEQFDYKLNKNSILYHGMKIIKIHSKSNQGYISVLCINIGSNTFKANQFSNILYLFERKKEYKQMYELLGENRKQILIIIIVVFIVSIVMGIVFYFTLYVDKFRLKPSEMVKLLYISLIRIFCKSLMPMFFLTNSLILLLGLLHLKGENIVFFEKSRLAGASTIDTIFFSKTGTLCENKFEINGYHPVYINPHKTNIISFKTFNINQCKEINSQLLKYYQNYLNKSKNAANPNFNLRQALRVEHNQSYNEKINNEINEYSTLFLECLLSCNNLEKYNIEIYGNIVEETIFQNMGWDIKTNDINNNDNASNINDYISLSQISQNYFYKNDIYPNNYYKITESINKETIQSHKPVLTRLNTKYYLELKKNGNNESLEESKSNNFIKADIIQSKINSYKLRIYKRFIKNGTLTSSAIVYNFITKELRFMTKGYPEDIIEKCISNTLPDNFDKILSLYRKMGYIVIICASKIINTDYYSESKSIEDYMSELTFCGFITLKNKLKSGILNSIKDLRQFNCNLIISTGDNIYNSLSVGFNSSILENKNIFAFDKDDKRNNLTITQLYNTKKLDEPEKNEETKNPSTDKLSKQTSRISNKIYLTPNVKLKESYKLKNEESDIRASKTKTSDINNKDFSLNQQAQENNEYNNLAYKPYRRRGSIRKINKTSKNLNFLNRFGKNQNRIRTYSDISEPQFRKEKKPNSRYSKINNMNYEQNDTLSKRKKTINDNKENQDTNTNRKLSDKNRLSFYLEKYYYYPKIFEEHEELDNNCIYCVSGKAFSFLYKNKGKKQCKYLLEKIHKNCKIFYDMSSLDKSTVIDFFREYPDNCVCTIGESSSDIDALMTSHIGIMLKPPKNRNTLLCHAFSIESSILSIKTIIREGRAIKENIILLKISCTLYTLILNSYIICCFIRQVDVIIGQLNFLEIFFLIMSISAFTGKKDNNKKSNHLIEKKKLYLIHYFCQVIGLIIIKLLSIFLHGKNFVGNKLLDEKLTDYIYCTYYFILCIEQLFSTIFVLNLITFYRKDCIRNKFFIFINLVLLIYFVILISLNSSNYRWDIFNISVFEFFENIIDSFDDHNRILCFRVCLFDFGASIIYSRSIYFLFDFLASR